MNEQTNFNNSQSDKEHEKMRGLAMIFAGIVYTGVVFAATTLFISFILTAFPNNAFGSRLIMAVAGLLVGGSMLAFPVALHFWATSGTHRSVAIGLYYGEMLIIAVNSVVSFAALLYRNAGVALPDWVAWYEPFSIVSIVYTLLAWGTVFLLDPRHQLEARERAHQDKFKKKIADKVDEFLDSIEGEDAISENAQEKIREMFQTKRDRHFGSGRVQTDRVLPSFPASLPRLPVQSKTCLYCGAPSDPNDFCSVDHEAAYYQVKLNELKQIQPAKRTNGQNP